MAVLCKKMSWISHRQHTRTQILPYHNVCVFSSLASFLWRNVSLLPYAPMSPFPAPAFLRVPVKHLTLCSINALTFMVSILVAFVLIPLQYVAPAFQDYKQNDCPVQVSRCSIKAENELPGKQIQLLLR